MVSKRRRERRAKRQRESQSQQKMLLIGGGVLVAAVIIFLIVQNVSQSDRTPRANRVSAAGLTKADGTDPCDLFPAYTGAETAPPEVVIDKRKDYAAWIITAKGEIVLDLYANIAPSTVNSFMFLACSGFYDNLTFHRVVPGFVVQGGDPAGDGTGGPPYTIPDEFSLSDLEFDRAGLLSMAHTQAPDSAGSQFFITLAPTPNLNGSFTIFGEVVKGMDVVEAITPRDPDDPATASNIPDVMQTIVVRQVSP